VPPSPNKRPSTPDLHSLLRRQTPLLDVRAPAEFAHGNLPQSVNLPILNDHERAQIGTMYKKEGPAAATNLGHRLVSGDIKAARVSQWQAFIADNPQAQLMCWRGGQRSQIAQTWLAEQDCQVQRVPGGYKALRKACLEILSSAPQQNKPWWVVAGRTGVQKTVLIEQLANSIDLERLANHRGSAFGARATPQPTPACFENRLACAYLRHDFPALVLEDESRTIGRLGLPGGWHQRMQTAPLVLIEASLASRVEHIVTEYVTQPVSEGADAIALGDHYQQALTRVKRRLGGVLHQHIDKLIKDAFQNKRPHQDWVHALMTDYYDPMYDYQLTNKEPRIVFRGTLSQVRDYLGNL